MTLRPPTPPPRLPIVRQCAPPRASPSPRVRNLAAVPRSHPDQNRICVCCFQIAVPRQSPERKEFRITVITEIEHPRETRRGEARLVPKSIRALVPREIVDTAHDGGMIGLA